MSDCFNDVMAKVFAKRNVINVHEDAVFAIMGGEPIANATRHHVGISAAIRDRDLWHSGLGKTVAMSVPLG
jgi:hypothetical protein